MTGVSCVIQGNALDLPLPDSCVDLVCTSPPYFAQRTYAATGPHVVGAEATVSEYLNALITATREMVRVLKPTGSIWVNLGDKYFSKSLVGLPWRYALRCLDELGLLLRAEVVWSKPNGIPESVADRVRRSHEQWFHFTVQSRYFAAVDEIREPYDMPFHATRTKGKAMNGGLSSGTVKDNTAKALNPLGKLPGSVWTIATQPLKVPTELGVDHFAAYPMEWPRRIVKGWAPPGGVVLDPFGGAGTTALVAKTLGRVGISLDLSVDYCRLAAWRCLDSKQIARASRVPA